MIGSNLPITTTRPCLGPPKKNQLIYKVGDNLFQFCILKEKNMAS